MVTERTIINALILAASFLLVPFIISEWLTVDYLPALCFAAMMGMVVAFFFIKNNLVIFPLLGAFWSGALNFLPLSMTPYHIACIFLILYFITGYVLIRQRPIKLGKPLFLWPMAIVTAIIFYHNHSLSLGSLGGDSEGGKAAILIYMVVVGYFCAINLPSPSPEVFSRIPYYAVLATMISSAPFVITTWVPALAPYLYVITNSVNIESYFDSVTGGTGGVFSKLAAFGPMGSVTQLYLLSHFPIGTWLRPNRWWVAVLSLICFALVASSGYRSDMFGYFATLVIGTWCYYSWRAVILPATALVAITILSIAGSNNLIQVPYRQLPEITQRTLSFLPGDWDPDAIESGKGSDEFRDNIKKVYFEEYAGISPLFGNGFTINTAEFMAQNDARKIGGPNDQAYHEAKSFIEGKLFHTGWLSLYDCVGSGWIGCICNLFVQYSSCRLSISFWGLELIADPHYIRSTFGCSATC